MKILFLYNNNVAIELADWLTKENHNVYLMSEKLQVEYLIEQKFDLVMSYSYKYMITEPCIKFMQNNIINLHISYLPWNKGSNPNLWSLIQNTPKGVSIHFVTPQLDCGEIIAQRLVNFETSDTLATSYRKLNVAIQELFKHILPYFNQWDNMAYTNSFMGTFHNLKDFEKYQHIITSYDMLITDFVEMVKQYNEKHNISL